MEPRTVSAPVRQIPNALTLLRFAAIPVFIWLLLDDRSGPSWPAGIVFGLAAITDQLDGYLARRWRVESQFGKVADPLADRLMIDTAVVMLVAFDRLPWVALIILLRDLLLIGGYKLVVPRGYEFEVSRLGKIATWGLYASIGLVLVTVKGTWWPLALLLGQPRARRDRRRPVHPEGAARGAALGRKHSRAAPSTCRQGERRAGRNRHSRPTKPQAEVDPFATLQLRPPRSRTERHPWKRFPTCSRSPMPSCRRCSRSIEGGEEAISQRRRVLHGRIDILRAERTERLRAQVATGSFETHPLTTFERPIYEGTGDVPAEAELSPLPDLGNHGRRGLVGGDPAPRAGRGRHLAEPAGDARPDRHHPCRAREARARRCSTSTRVISARSSAEANEPHLLPGVRLPEPRGGDVLLALWRAARFATRSARRR